MKGYEILYNSLKDAKINFISGNPGTTEIPMLRSVDNYYLSLHDSIALGMADGYSLYNSGASMVNLHTMPGLGNSMAFLFTAKMNRSPVIVTAGQQDTRHLVYDPLLSGDTMSMVSDFVKYKYEIKNPEDIPVALKRAREIALTPPMGPVFLSFPMDIMDYNGEYYKQQYQDPNYNISDEEAIKDICDKINRAKNPAIVFGYEIDLYNAFKEAGEFAKKLGVKVYSEPLASRSTYNTEQDNYAGDLLPASTLMNLNFIENDLIVFIGGDIIFYPYLPSKPFAGKDVIFVGTDLSHKTGESYFMNPKLFLEKAKSLVNKKGNYHKSRDLTFPNKIARERLTMGVNYVLYMARKIFKDYTVVDESISATENVRSIFGYGSKKYFTAKTGQLGWALPASTGISVNNRKTLVIIGDGSFMYTVQSLWTMKKYNLPVKILVLNNGGYNILKSFADSYYPEMQNRDYLTLNLDIESISKGFNIDTMVASNDLGELEWLREGDGPKVLVVNTDKNIEKMFL